MKGTVLVCLSQLVKEKFGAHKWAAITTHAGVGANYIVLAAADVPDELTFKLIGSTCEVLGISQQQAFDAFGEYWMCTYGPRVYPAYYQDIKTAREFIAQLDELHTRVMKNIPNSKPPRFDYQWIDKKTVVMNYKSSRGLLDLMISMAKGAAKYFKEEIQVTKRSDTQVHIAFSRE